MKAWSLEFVEIVMVDLYILKQYNQNLLFEFVFVPLYELNESKDGVKLAPIFTHLN